MAQKRDSAVRIRVWDIPTRLFHWLLVALFAFSWWTAENDQLDWHMFSGYAILMLVLFRVYWGVVGSGTARFATFIKGPKAVLAYIRRVMDRPGHSSPGHNPMGGWSVAAMLILLLLQVGLGLFAIDVDGLNAGPLNKLVSFEAGRQLARLHGTVFNLLLVLTGLHVAAILFYYVYKRENLIAAMIGGSKPVPRGTTPSEQRFTKLRWAVPGLVVAGAIVYLIAFGRF